jgi:hypothetical protein
MNIKDYPILPRDLDKKYSEVTAMVLLFYISQLQ